MSAQDSWPDFMEAEVESLEAWQEQQLEDEELFDDDRPSRDWTEDPQ